MIDKMPPVHSKPQEAQKITTLPDETLDLFDIVTNVVTKLNSQIVYKKAKPKRKFNELLDLYGIDLPSHLETLPSFETCSKLVNLPNLNDFAFDIDENVISAVISKY